MFVWIHEAIATVAEYLGLTPVTVTRFLYTAAAVGIFFAVRAAMHHFFEKRITDLTRRYFAFKTATYLLGFIVFVLLLRIWFGGSTGLAAYFGIMSAGLAIALQDPLTNLAGWFFITARKPFAVGDRIQLGENRGDVIDVRLFSFSLIEIGQWVDADQSTGRIIHIPNGQVFKQPVANYTHGFNFIWHEIPVTVTFESDWRRAKEILEGIAGKHTAIKSEEAAQQVKRAARKYLIFFEHLTPIVWVKVIDYGVTLTIRYLADPRRRRSSEHGIWADILDAFAKEESIDFAYPTTRFYDNAREGKPGARAP